MTENNAAQPVLTDDEIRTIIRNAHQSHGAVKTGYCLSLGRAIESALLSKLRAPVADERAAFERFQRRTGLDELYLERHATHGQYMWTATKEAWETWQARAALASAPVAGEAQPTDAEIIDLAVEPLGIDCDRMPHGVVVFARNLLSRYAAPQASEAGKGQQ